MNSLIDSLKLYYSSLQKHYVQWNNYESNCVKIVKKIVNQSEQYRLAKRLKLDGEVSENASFIQEKLLFNILTNLEGEMETLENIRRSMEDTMYRLERQYDKVDLNWLNFTSVQSDDLLNLDGCFRCDKLVQKAQYFFIFYQSLFVRFNAALKLCDFNSEESIKQLLDVVNDKEISRDEVESVIALGKIFIESYSNT